MRPKKRTSIKREDVKEKNQKLKKDEIKDYTGGKGKVRSLTNDSDSKEVNESFDRKSNFLKLNPAKTFIRFLTEDYVAEYVHSFMIGNDFYNIPCPGGVEGQGYVPDICPFCAEGKKHWDAIKEIKNEHSDWETNKKIKSLIAIDHEIGKKMQSKLQVTFIAVKADAVKEKTASGKTNWAPDEWSKQSKFLNISKSQYAKLTKVIFEKYDFMRSSADLVNRDLLFVKVEKAGQAEGSKFTEVDIEPMASKSSMPEVENELPDFDTVFHYMEIDEMESVLEKYLSVDDNSKEDDAEEEEDDDIEEEEDDYEDKKHRRTSSSKKVVKKSSSRRDDKF